MLGLSLKNSNWATLLGRSVARLAAPGFGEKLVL